VAAVTPERDPVRRIAVVRALPGVGDLLCAVPALRAVRGAHPTAHVTLVGLPTAGWFVDRFPHLVDDLLPVCGVPGLPEVVPDPLAAMEFYATAQACRFDLALQLHGSGVVTNPLTAMLGARRMVATYVDAQWCPPGVVVSHPAADHEILRLLAVTTAAGCPPAGGDIDLPVHPEERAEARALVGDVTDGLGDPCPYACLHPGASRGSNRWPPDRFARVADRLYEAGMAVVLTGTARERPVVDAVARAMSAPAIDACGRTGVGTLAALFERAALVVSNDTGAAHVAAAVRAPSVVVFRAGADHDRWAPLDTVRHVPVVPPRDDDDPWPTVDDVLAGAVRHLAGQLARRPVEEAS
jgi:ADP-heptose:LPS heptosyltransferase